MHNFRVSLARMRDLRAVLHQEPSIERDAGLMPDAHADLRLMKRVPGRTDRLRDPIRHQVHILRVRVRLEATGDRPAAVRVTRADEHLIGRNLRLLLDRRPSPGRGLRRDEERVDPDQGHRRVARANHHRHGVQPVENLFQGPLAHSPRALHARLGGNVRDAKSHV